MTETHRSVAIEEHPGKEKTALWRLLSGQSTWMYTRTASKHLTPHEDNTRNLSKATKPYHKKGCNPFQKDSWAVQLWKARTGADCGSYCREDLTLRWSLLLHGFLEWKAQGNLWLDTDGVQGAPATDASSRLGMVRMDGRASSDGT